MQGDWDHPPFQAECFDLVVFFAALHHSADLLRTLRQVHHVLGRGGWLYATHEPMSSRILGPWQRKRMRTIAEEEDGIESSPSFREYRDALEGVGFEKISIRSSSLNLIRLLETNAGFDDVRKRRPDWPERGTRIVLRLLAPCGEGVRRTFLFFLQRNLFGLFGVTVQARKP